MVSTLHERVTRGNDAKNDDDDKDDVLKENSK